MVFHILPTLRILVLEDEVHLVCGSTLVRTKHDGIWRFIVKFLRFPPSFLRSKILKICTTTFKSILEAGLKLENNCPVLKTYRLIKLFDNCILVGLLTNKNSKIIMPFTLSVLPDT